MTELERKLRAAMHAAVDDAQPPRDLTARVIRRHRRRTAVLASLSVATCAAVAIAVLPAVLPSHGGTPTGPSPLGPGHPTSRLHGTAMPPGSDVRLLFGYPRIAWYSTATRRTVPITGMSGWVVLGRVNGGFLGGVFGTAGPNHQFYYIAAGAKAATRIGTAFSVVPASSAGYVWRTRYSSTSRHSLGRTQLASIDGRPIGKSITLPAPRTLVLAGVGRYLLLTHFDTSDRGPAKLWDPASRRMVHAFPRTDAIGPEQVAWAMACDGCPVRVFDARTGRTSSFAIPRGWQVPLHNASDAAFSPDGTMLAVELAYGMKSGYDVGQSGRLAVINLATGHLAMVPGADLTGSAAGILNFDWQSGTHRLVLTLPVPDRPNMIQVGYWQPGAARLRLTTARLPQGQPTVYVQ